MTNSPQVPPNSSFHVLGVVILAMASFTLSPFIFIPAMARPFDLSMQDLLTAVANSESSSLIQLILLGGQFATAFLSFIVIPAYFIKKHESGGLNGYFFKRTLGSTAIIITAGLTLSVMVVNSLLIQWNMGFEFTEPIADTLDRLEKQGKLMTEYLTDFYSLPYFLFVIVVVAVVPAIGEELLFRGLIQRKLQGTMNPHIAIWLTAAIFSAFHLQFYGFLPRMALGAFFGYLFYFSGNLWYSSIAHFINNGTTLLMIYLFQQGTVEHDIESTENISFWSVFSFVIIGWILFVLFRKQFHITGNLQNE